MNEGVTLTGYAVLAAGMVAYQLVSLLRRRTPTLGQTLKPIKTSLPGRIILLAGWMWIGWHLFVRGDWA